ncbi:MAG: hypothetical protein HYV14_12935 [Elusimicrobia bacterium]|nr:hypothetical protein [Elusimicrobiota bacterium]
MATERKAKKGLRRAHPDRPGHVGEVRILESSRTRGLNIRVHRPSKRAR